MITFVENPKESSKKIVEIRSEFGMWAGYTINIFLNQSYFYMSNEQLKIKIIKKYYLQ